MSKRLFVGNLPFSAKEPELMEYFAAYGASAVTIPTNPDGRSKGFAFVDVEDDKMESAVNDLNGKEMGGRALNINEARPREDRGSRPSGGGYGNNDQSGYGASSGHGSY
jgi:RNA recognition motif-containing protein